MNEFEKLFLSILATECLGSVTIKEDDESIILEYKKPVKAIKEFHKYIDDMNDDIFEEASVAFKDTHPKEFDVLMEDVPSDTKLFEAAVAKFKETVSAVAKFKVHQLSEQVDKLQSLVKEYSKYI